MFCLFCLSVCLSVSPSVYLSLFLSVSVCVCLSFVFFPSLLCLSPLHLSLCQCAVLCCADGGRAHGQLQGAALDEGGAGEPQ